MHLELGKAMPVNQVKQKLENAHIVGFRKEAIKDWYSMLDESLDVTR